MVSYNAIYKLQIPQSLESTEGTPSINNKYLDKRQPLRNPYYA